MPLADKQRDALIVERGEPKLRLEFDVFADGQISMTMHAMAEAWKVFARQMSAVAAATLAANIGARLDAAKMERNHQ